MSQMDILKRFGVVVVPNFLDVMTCERIIAEIGESKRTPATMYQGGLTKSVDEQTRKALSARVSPDLSALVVDRLYEYRHALEESFGMALGEIEDPTFLQYRAGDFIVAHRDSNLSEHALGFIRRRAVSVIIFLNGQSDEPETGRFGGGSFVLYSLVPDPRCERIGFPVKTEPGALLTFRSHLFHEVTPVTHGERYSIVTWFGSRAEENVSEGQN